MKTVISKKEHSYKIIHYDITQLDTIMTLKKKLSAINKDPYEYICLVFEYNDNGIASPKLFHDPTVYKIAHDAKNFLECTLHQSTVSKQNVLYQYAKLLNKKRAELVATVDTVMFYINEQRALNGYKLQVKYFIIPMINVLLDLQDKKNSPAGDS